MYLIGLRVYPSITSRFSRILVPTLLRGNAPWDAPASRMQRGSEQGEEVISGQTLTFYVSRTLHPARPHDTPGIGLQIEQVSLAAHARIACGLEGAHQPIP